MNAMKKAILAVLLLLATTGRAGAQVSIGDSCFTLNWKYFPPVTDSATWNPDSILVDTCLVGLCQCGDPVIGAWIKRGFYIYFDTNTIPLGWAPHDADVEVTWQAIDTSYPALRSAFQNLEQRFGTYTLKKQYPDDTGSIEYGARDFFLILSNYVPFDSIYFALDSVSEIQTAFYWPVVADVVPILKRSTNNLQLFPNPAGSEIQISCNGDTFKGGIQILNPLGIVVKTVAISDESSSVTIDISDLPSGYYYLICNGNFLPFTHLK